MKFYLITITILIPFLSYSQIEKIDTVADTLQVNNKTSTKLTVKYWMDSTKTSIIQQQEVVKSQQTAMLYTNLTEFSYYIKNSKLHQCKNGQLRPIKMTIKLKNDATISTTGMLKMNDGNTLQLKNGDAIDKNGIITKYKR